MTEGVETVNAVENGPSALGSSSGLLDAIHQRWLEHTEGGDSQLIASRLNQQSESGEPDEESCIMLLDGYIAKIGSEHVSETLSEASAYRAGKRALQTYFESVASTKSKRMKLWDILGVIDDAYEPDKLAEMSQENEAVNGSAPELPTHSPLKPELSPRIVRVKRQYERNPGSTPWGKSQLMEALDAANQSKLKQAEIRAGLRQGKISLGEALNNPLAERMAISDLLRRVPKVGVLKTRNALKVIGAADASEVGALDSAQRNQLSEMFPLEKHQPDERRKRKTSRKQAMASLEQANEIRICRADLKKKLAAGEVTVEELFDNPAAAGMKLREMLLKLPTRVATKPENVRSIKLMDVVLHETGLLGGRPLNQLTMRQQKILLDRLTARYKEDTGTYTYRPI